MTNGIVCEAKQPVSGKRSLEILTLLLLYASLWGALCGMAALSSLGVLPLAAGGVLLFALSTLRRPALRSAVLTLGLGGAILLVLLRPQEALDGVQLLLNRFFAASEARQAYTYEMFSVTSNIDWQDHIRFVLLPLGLLSGALCALVPRWKGLAVLLFAALAGWSAYLGVAPSAPWCAALAAALTLTCLNRPTLSQAGLWLLVLSLTAGAVLLLAPGEDPALSAWEEAARDALAVHTVAYGQRPEREEPDPASPGQDREFQREEADVDLDDGPTPWPVPPSALLVILAAALLLFLPAVLSDHQRKRRTENRRGLDDPDPNAAICAMFLYTFRWLRLGGLERANLPFSGYSPQVEAVLSPELRRRYDAALPLWQEAAYSDHPMTGEQRQAMRDYMEFACRTVWGGMSRKERLLARYYHAL